MTEKLLTEKQVSAIVSFKRTKIFNMKCFIIKSKRLSPDYREIFPMVMKYILLINQQGK